MANEIGTYAQLGTAIVAWYKDRSDLSDYVDPIIDLAEAYFNLKIRHRKMETVDDLTPTNNVCTLPTDYVAYKRVVELASIRRPLEYITEDAAEGLYPTRAGGLACHFIIVGDELTALPLSSNDIELTYYAAIPALSGSNTTNWLLTKVPSIYLHACLGYAAEFTKDPGAGSTKAEELAIADGLIDMLNAESDLSKFYNAGKTLPGVIW